MFKMLVAAIMTLISVWILDASDAVYRADEDEHCNRTVDIYQSVSSPPITEQNRNRPLHCIYQIRVRPARSDWVVFVRFTRMRVGEPSEDRQKCIGGYLQIIDGYQSSNQTNANAPGFFCGEIDSPKKFVSETPHVEIVLHVDRYSQEAFLQFDATVEQQQEVHAKYGQYAQLYPHRRGIPVPGTYCERIFHGCVPTQCYVQSPGFPGIYPRNLHCRYKLSVGGGRSAVSLEVEKFDVDGVRCDNLLRCFPRPVSRDPKHCPYDRVVVYDGPTMESPQIVTLCGRGRLKSHIVGSGPEMLIEFQTSPAGPPLNAGFHFKAEDVHAEAEVEHHFPRLRPDGKCEILRHLRPGETATYGHLRSWYPPNTTCNYRFTSSEDEVLKMTFDFFKVERVTLCKESLKLYDSAEADPSRIMSKLCDINRPRTEHPKSVYETSGSSLFVEFVSKMGSLEGSSASYAFEIRPVNVITRRNLLSGSSCSNTFTPTTGQSGMLAVPPPVPDGGNNASRTCNYTFDASSTQQGRVRLVVVSPLQLQKECSDCRSESVYAQLHIGQGERFCYCKSDSQKMHTFTSLGSLLYLSVHVDKRAAHKTVLNASYFFFAESHCGPDKLVLDIQGLLTFPPLLPGPGVCLNAQCSEAPIFCEWNIPVFHRMDLLLKVEGMPDHANCSTDHTTVGSVVLCPSSDPQEVLLRKEDIHDPDVKISLRLSGRIANFTIRWTQLQILPSRSSPETLVSLGKDCDFLCTSSMACLTRELVCNDVANCPGPGSPDEDPSLCTLPRDGIRLYWWIIGFGVGVCSCLGLCLILSLCRKCRTRRHRI